MGGVGSYSVSISTFVQILNLLNSPLQRAVHTLSSYPSLSQTSLFGTLSLTVLFSISTFVQIPNHPFFHIHFCSNPKPTQFLFTGGSYSVSISTFCLNLLMSLNNGIPTSLLGTLFFSVLYPTQFPITGGSSYSVFISISVTYLTLWHFIPHSPFFPFPFLFKSQTN